MRWSHLILVSILLVGLTVLGFTVKAVKTDMTIKEIERGYDNRLDTFKANKTLAMSVIDIMNISSQKEYDTARNKLTKFLSHELVNEYFPTNEYKGGEKQYSVWVDSARGTYPEGITEEDPFAVSNDGYIYKVKAQQSINNKGVRELDFLVHIDKSGVVYKIQSIGL